MKLTTKLIAITLMLASATLAATGACTKDKCGYCAMTGTDKYCEKCVGAAIFGTAADRKCEGGTAITGCLTYENTDATANGKAYCSGCDTAGGYQLIAGAGGDKTKNTCVKPIANCTTALSATECTTCSAGYVQKAADKTCIAITAANCKVGIADKAAECATCNDGYGLKTADKTCVLVTTPNCKVGVDD